MKIKNGLLLHDVCGVNVLVAEGEENIEFSKIISFNETATCIWKAMEGRDFTVEDMANALMEEYDVDRQTAQTDCQTLAEQWKEAGIIA